MLEDSSPLGGCSLKGHLSHLGDVPSTGKEPPLYTMILKIKIPTVASDKDPENFSLLHALLRY